MSWKSNALGRRWVHLFLWSLFLFSLPLHFSFQNKQQGSLGTDYSSLHHWLFQPFSLLTNVQPQMVDDGILWNSLSKLTFTWMERKVKANAIVVVHTMAVLDHTSVLHVTLLFTSALSKCACRYGLIALPALIQLAAAASFKQLHTDYLLQKPTEVCKYKASLGLWGKNCCRWV